MLNKWQSLLTEFIEHTRQGQLGLSHLSPIHCGPFVRIQCLNQSPTSPLFGAPSTCTLITQPAEGEGLSWHSHAWPWGSLLVHGQCPAHPHGARVFLLSFRATWVMSRAMPSPGQCSQDERATASPARPVPSPVQPPLAPSLLFPPENQPAPIWVPRGPRGLILLLQRDTVSFSLFSTSSLDWEGSQPPTLALHLFLMVNSQKYYLLCISLNFSSQGKLLIRLRPWHWLQWLHSLSFNLYKVPTCLLKVKPCYYLLSNVPKIFIIYSFNQYMFIEHLLSVSSVLTAGDTWVNPKIKVPCPMELKYNRK